MIDYDDFVATSIAMDNAWLAGGLKEFLEGLIREELSDAGFADPGTGEGGAGAEEGVLEGEAPA